MSNVDLAAPVFVVGYMHSGTTLLHNILSANPAVYSAADETRYFGYLPLLSNLYPDLTDAATLDALIVMLAELVEQGNPARLRSAPPRYRPESSSLTAADLVAIRDAMCPEPTHAAVFPAVFDYLTQRARKQRWLEKTPQHVFLIDGILREVPTALFVEIVRDPRDILASKKKRKQTIQTATQYAADEKQIKVLERVYDPLWDSLEWRFALRAGQAAREQYPARVYTLRYEDLVAEPEAVTRQVCAFLGLSFGEDMLDVRWWNTAEGDRAGQSGIVSSAVGRWAQTLSPAEIALCQSVSGAQFQRFEYTRTPVSPLAWLIVPWLVIRAGLGMMDRLIRRWRLGGFPFLMNTLKNYWKEIRKLF